MSFDVQKNWLYHVKGRNIHLYQVVDSGNTDTLGDYKIRLPEDYRGKSLMYPSESITSGLRFDGTSFIEPFVDLDPNELVNGANPTLEEVAIGADIESAHINLSRLLSLAVVDYIRANLADIKGSVQLKDYYMREFWKKVGDEQSNRRKITSPVVSSPYAVR